jgi:carboxymethylenebutenolidase
VVLFYMDGLAIRPALFEMGERLASNGYYVLMPDMFWRLGPYEPLDPKKVMNDPELRQELFTKFLGSTDPERAMRDTGAFFAWLDKQPKAKADKVGTTGYCMGGSMSLRAAAAFPERVVAAGSFHAGNVVTDAPDSVHRLAPKIRAKVLFAAGDQDQYHPEEAHETFAKAMADAGVDGVFTIYRGALHGYAPPDTHVYDREASERHWREMLALFGETLKQPAAA